MASTTVMLLMGAGAVLIGALFDGSREVARQAPEVLLLLGASDARNDDGVLTGAAYVFHRDDDGSWSEIAKLTASDGMEFEDFGRGVTINGRFVIVGAPQAGFGGAAYVFAESDCVLKASIGDDREISPGEILQVDLSLHHNRLATVTVPFILWVEDSAGNVVASHVTAPHTFHYGDEVNATVKFPLPEDLAPGEYRFLIGVDNMNPPRARAEERFRVVVSELGGPARE